MTLKCYFVVYSGRSLHGGCQTPRRIRVERARAHVAWQLQQPERNIVEIWPV